MWVSGMRELGPASNDEMVLAFLRAEIDSPRAHFYLQALSAYTVDRSLVDNADLADDRANRVRVAVLGAVRGYGRNERLFYGFPSDTKWRRVLVDPSEFSKLRYLNDGASWVRLAESRSVEDGARNCINDAGLAARICALVQAINCGAAIPDLILIEDTDRLVVLEGNNRATAYVKAATTSIRAFVGSSPTMHQWHFL
jgi:hypothetical protein